MARFFTRAEAEALLPQLTPLLLALQQEWEEVVVASTEVAAMRQRMAGNGHGLIDEMNALARRYDAVRAIANARIAQVRAFECEIKDPRTGLIDFPAQLFGRTVLLCWQLGEPGISWWHETNEGFDRRQPLDD